MPESPPQPDLLEQDVSDSFGLTGATTSDSYELRESPVTATTLRRDLWTNQLMFNVVIPLGLLLVGGLTVLALGKVQPEQLPPADMSRAGRLRALPRVEVAKVQSLRAGESKLHLKAEGSVVPYREAQVAAEVAGRIVHKEAVCEAGSFVRAGDLLMKIDARDYELEVNRLTAAKEQEYQAIQEVDQEVLNTQRLIKVAQEDVDLQQKEVNRQKSLPAGFASRAEIDQAERALLQSRQTLVTYQNQLDLLKKRRVRLEASERLAATQLLVAEENLKRTKIFAPIDGVIVNEDAELNTFVARGNPLVTIEDTSKVEVACNLRMDQLHWVLDQERKRTDDASLGYDLPETPAYIEYAMSGRDGVVYRWNGRLLSYDGIGLDPGTRTVPVRLIVDDPRQYIDEDGNPQETSGPTALVRGMYVQIKLLIRPKTPLVVIPAEAIRPGNRIWQFTQDESVLEIAKADEDANAQDAAVEPDPVSDDEIASESSQDGDNKFRPEDWTPGMVTVRRQITPVESLEIADSSEEPDEASLWEGRRAAKYWVCEVAGQTITDGSYVVTSQLGAVPSEGLSARTEFADIDADPGSSNAKAEKSDLRNVATQLVGGDTSADSERVQ